MPRCAARPRSASFSGFAAGIELYGEETILAFTRVLGAAMATVAEGALSVFGKQIGSRDEAQLAGHEYVLAAMDALESFRLVPDVLQVVAKLQFDLATDRLNGDPGQHAVGRHRLRGPHRVHRHRRAAGT